MTTFAFYGRVSTEDKQDPKSSRDWQLKRASELTTDKGEIVTEFFDIGQSRSLPWQRRPEAALLLAALSAPDRGFDAVVVGEPQRAFSGNQFSLTFPLFVHHNVGLWVPEVGGAVDPDSEAHDLVMTLFGGMSKGERNRIRTRVRTAMKTQAKDGRFLGGRPPYGYKITDIGNHPNPEKARNGQRLHQLEPNPETAPNVKRIFAEFINGAGYAKIATNLTLDGVLSPSGYDPDRNKHRQDTQGIWAKSAVRSILLNPRYTGYSVWAKQRRNETLLDHTNVALGHKSKLEWNNKTDWIYSTEPTHPAIITPETFEQAQTIIGQRRRKTTTLRRTPNNYLFRSLIRCADCGRRMQGNKVRDHLQYRCVLPRDYPGTSHPKTLSVREDKITPIVDKWLNELFNPANIDSTCEALAHYENNSNQTLDEIEIRREIKQCDQELANYQTALKASPSETVAQWITETEQRRTLAEQKLARLATGDNMSPAEIRDTVRQMNGLINILENASPADRQRIYQEANLRIDYDHDQKAIKLHTATQNRECGAKVSEGGLEPPRPFGH